MRPRTPIETHVWHAEVATIDSGYMLIIGTASVLASVFHFQTRLELEFRVWSDVFPCL